ncbi:MAG: 16S rRNA (cytosine(1402)-N(4))-methyltransferase RsmH [Deltaproteobacteria bacterium]|nr:16S rRNA (cytosine(1402)-N(4))-methyltransferase RsmH [Deltaproteobacteria bacterium]
MIFHQPVMIREVVESLRCRAGGVYVDGTVGGGGHAGEILEQSAPDGILIGIDRDGEALAEAENRLRSFGRRKILVKGNFLDIAAILAGLDIEFVDGILLDLGVSSHQLEEARRGFSFAQEGPLDMRMDSNQVFSAADLVNNFAESELVQIIRDYGEERMAGRIARAIVRKRSVAPIETTTELAAVVRQAVPAAYGRQRIHPATRTFQAIRIAVNDELVDLPRAIGSGIGVLAGGGRFSIIAFHSLEDRVVKNEFRRGEGGCSCPPRLPVCICQHKAVLRVLTKKPLRPGREELAVNPRARSARLRTAERI